MPSSDLSRLKVICSCNGKAREAPGARFGLEFPGWQTSRRVSHQRGLFDNDRHNNTAQAGWTCSNASLLCADLDLDLHAVVA